MSPQFWWYLSRASGLVGWAVLTLALVWGVLLSTKLLAPRVRPPWMLDLHRWLGGTALVLVGVHLAALIADSYIPFRVVDLLVPFASSYKRGALAVGVLGLYLLIAVQISSLAMRRIPTSWWRWLHMTSYLLVFVVSLHAAMAGTDALRGFYRFATAVLVVVPVLAIGVRLGGRPPAVIKPPPTPPAARSGAARRSPVPPTSAPAPAPTPPPTPPPVPAPPPAPVAAAVVAPAPIRVRVAAQTVVPEPGGAPTRLPSP